MKMLRDQSSLSYTFYSRQEWEEHCAESGEEEGSQWWNLWAKPGFDLFEAGAENIIEIVTDSDVKVYAEHDAPSEVGALMEDINDFHAHYTLDCDQAHKVLKDSSLLHSHQQFRTWSQIQDAARELEWIK